MNDEERRGRQPWMPTEPMWSEREVKRRKENLSDEGSQPRGGRPETSRYRLPEQVKTRQANDLKRRFAQYLGEPKKRPDPTKRPRVIAVLFVILLFVATAIQHYKR